MSDYMSWVIILNLTNKIISDYMRFLNHNEFAMVMSLLIIQAYNVLKTTLYSLKLLQGDYFEVLGIIELILDLSKILPFVKQKYRYKKNFIFFPFCLKSWHTPKLIITNVL